MPAARQLVVDPSAAVRRAAAIAWLSRRPRDAELVVIGATPVAAASLLQDAAPASGATFGRHRLTLGRLAAQLAAPALAARGLAPAGRLALEALSARVVFRLADRGQLGRFAAVADRPGLPRALYATLAELGLSGHGAALLRTAPADDAARSSDRRHGAALSTALDDAAAVFAAIEAELERAGLADRATVLRLACERLRSDPSAPFVGLPLVLLDLPLDAAVEAELVAELARRSENVLATGLAGDEPTTSRLAAALGVAPGVAASDASPSAGVVEIAPGVARVQRELFSGERAPKHARSEEVVVLSAPGESRECVEIARLVHDAAQGGVPFDRMAIVLRTPGHYRAHLEEALRRAGVPAYFEAGARRPDPTGRAMLALLGCAAEGLSARRFAEYLSLGQLPDPTDVGSPPDALPSAERWVVPDEELAPLPIPGDVEDPGAVDDDDLPASIADPENAPAAQGSLRAPRRWERLLVDAAVIGGLDRWERRLGGLERERELDLDAIEDRDGPNADRIRQDLAALANLRAFALPLLAELAALPRGATWSRWIDALGALATRALRRPERVLTVLAELAPMGEIGPVDLAEVRLVLDTRLGELVVPATGRRHGRVFVAPVDAVRGLEFDVVFIPGLAEKLFPQKLVEDPILSDAARALVGLRGSDERARAERRLLHLAVGAAKRRLVASYPRVDMDQSRPRVPSFYGLEIVRAAEGRLPGWGALAQRAESAGKSRIGWPAPDEPGRAVDEAEHDLALLATLLHRPESETVGTARYLLGTNPHLARSLRFRARRWNVTAWRPCDGLVRPLADDARQALAKNGLSKRAYSATALQSYSACPYRFFLYAIQRLKVREVPHSIDEMDPLQRGSLVHEIQFELLSELRDAGLLPPARDAFEAARARLDTVLDRVASRAKDKLCPAIDRVWDDGIALVRADLREWLRHLYSEPKWAPWRFELSFGLSDRRPEDPNSLDEPVPLGCGIALRGSIDLVEQSPNGTLRATDHKTGRARAGAGTLVGGGETLQPVLYALALEKLFPDKIVEAGRLHYCTLAGGYADVEIVLDEHAREAAEQVAATIRTAIDDAFLPAAPAPGACTWCDYAVVCGPYEELRTTKYKSQRELVPLARLRGLP